MADPITNTTPPVWPKEPIHDDALPPNTDKLAAMREAMNDPLFLADLREIAEDFRFVDAEAEAPPTRA